MDPSRCIQAKQAITFSVDAKQNAGLLGQTPVSLGQHPNGGAKEEMAQDEEPAGHEVAASHTRSHALENGSRRNSKDDKAAKDAPDQDEKKAVDLQMQKLIMAYSSSRSDRSDQEAAWQGRSQNSNSNQISPTFGASIVRPDNVKAAVATEADYKTITKSAEFEIPDANALTNLKQQKQLD